MSSVTPVQQYLKGKEDTGYQPLRIFKAHTSTLNKLDTVGCEKGTLDRRVGDDPVEDLDGVRSVGFGISWPGMGRVEGVGKVGRTM